MGILLIIILPFIIVPFALQQHGETKEKQMQPYHEAVSAAVQDEACIAHVNTSRLEDERMLLNSIIDYTQDVSLTSVQEDVLDTMLQELNDLTDALGQVYADIEELRQKAYAERSYAENCKAAAEESSSGMEPFIILGSAFMLGIICCVIGLAEFGIGLILLAAFIGTPVTLGVAAYLSERNVRIRHENGIYDRNADLRDHIDTGILAVFAAKSAYNSYRGIEDMHDIENDDE